MKTSNPLKTQLIPVFAVLTAMMLLAGLASSVWSAEQKSEAPPPQTNSVPATTNSASLKPAAPDKKAPKRKHQLTGAELYSMHCNRCHPERYPTERTAAQWKTIMLHMQVRVNLPADQAKLILKYLQDNSGR
jgi:hypothetical protein